MNPTTILTMADGVRVVVPDSLERMTSYVLLEQQDWFEDEIKFLRRPDLATSLLAPRRKEERHIKCCLWRQRSGWCWYIW